MRSITQKIVGIMMAALVAAMVFTGVAMGAQTSLDLDVTGNAFSSVNYKTSTSNELPFETNDYSLNVFVVDGKDVSHTHYLDAGYDIEAETTLKANEVNTFSVIWVDELVGRDVIGNAVINENTTSVQCYSGNAGYSATANYLDFASTVLVTETDIDYAVAAAGNGRMRWVTEEYMASGEIVEYVNNTNKNDTNESDTNEGLEDVAMPEEASASWISTYVKEDVRANGIFTFEGSYYSEFGNFPAPAPEDEVGGLCPFGWSE